MYNEAVRKKAKAADLFDPALEPHLYHAAEKVRRGAMRSLGLCAHPTMGVWVGVKAGWRSAVGGW